MITCVILANIWCTHLHRLNWEICYSTCPYSTPQVYNNYLNVALANPPSLYVISCRTVTAVLCFNKNLAVIATKL